MLSTFHKVAKRSEVPPGGMKAVEVEGEQVLLVNLDGTFYAMNDVCSHAMASLAEGWLEGEEVECASHGSRFNVRTGEVTQGPADEAVATYAVRVEGDDLLVGPAKV